MLSLKTKVPDGRIFMTAKGDTPEEKLQLTKLVWETDGVRSVRNDIKIKEDRDFKRSAKDVLITSQLRTVIILNKNPHIIFIVLFFIFFNERLQQYIRES